MKIESSIKCFEALQRHRQAKEDLELYLITAPKHQAIKQEMKNFLENLK